MDEGDWLSSYPEKPLAAAEKLDKLIKNIIISTMIFLQELYSLVLAAKMHVHLGSYSRRILAKLLSTERKHRSLKS